MLLGYNCDGQHTVRHALSPVLSHGPLKGLLYRWKMYLGGERQSAQANLKEFEPRRFIAHSQVSVLCVTPCVL